MDTTRVHDDTLDAHYSGLERLEAPHGCYEGVVYIGHLVEDESGEEVEVVEAVPCRRCAQTEPGITQRRATAEPGRNVEILGRVRTRQTCPPVGD